jgi:hypothetical protein
MAMSKQNQRDEVMTLHAVMQASIGEGLQSRYNPEREIPHGLLVLLMQMEGEERAGFQQSVEPTKPRARRSR